MCFPSGRWGVVPNVLPSDSWDVAPCGWVFRQVGGGGGGGHAKCVFLMIAGDP